MIAVSSVLQMIAVPSGHTEQGVQPPLYTLECGINISFDRLGHPLTSNLA